MPCPSCIIKPPSPPETKSSPEKKSEKAGPEREFKRYVAKPDRYGVVQIPHDFIPAEDMDPITGEWPGWVEAKK